MFFGWFFVAFGLLFAAISIGIAITGIRDRRRLRTWTPSTAIIREIEKRSSSSRHGGSRIYWVARYDYRGPNGEEYADEGRLDAQRFAPDGSALPLRIVIDPLDPSRSMIANEGTPIGCLLVMATVFVAMGSIFALVGFAFTRLGSA